MATVDFEHVEKRFPGGIAALADTTLHIDDGERMVVVGPSGCGKSTLLRLLAGLESPSAGTIRIGDRAVNELTPQQRNVAMVFQDYALYPFRTVRGNLEFPLRLRGLVRSEIDRRIDEVARLLEIGALLDRRPAQLSGGQRQRVAMGRALVREPSVFLLDEPLSNLDARLRTQVRAEIADLQQRTGTTMLYVTHDQVEAMTLGHRVTVLEAGRLQQVATPRELYERPANAFVAGFIGSPPMSFFPTTVGADARGRTVVRIGDTIVPLDVAPGGAPPPHGERLRGGIRPEALAPVADGADSFPAVVEQTECLGHETLAAVRVDGADGATRLIVRLSAAPEVHAGERLRLRFDPSRLYLFAEDGRTVWGPSFRA